MFVILLVLWLIFAGSVTVTNLILGALVAGLITLLCTKFMGYDTRHFYRSLSTLHLPQGAAEAHARALQRRHAA